MVAVAFGRLSRSLSGGLDVVDIVDLVHEQAFGFDDDRDRLQGSDVFQPHRHCAGNGVADYHVYLRLAGEQSKHLTDVVALKFAHADPATFNGGIRFG